VLERFDPDAQAAVAKARDEAARSGKREVGTEHLLLGLLSRPGHAAAALTAAGADAEGLRAHIAPHDGSATSALPAVGRRGPERPGRRHAVGELPLTKHATHALHLALQARERLSHSYVSSGHLLLGIIDQPENGALKALNVAGIRVGAVRADVLQRLTSSPERGAQ
jgi:ATP-dependent Clp protease ATP-binding subunit ClpA